MSAATSESGDLPRPNLRRLLRRTEGIGYACRHDMRLRLLLGVGPRLARGGSMFAFTASGSRRAGVLLPFIATALFAVIVTAAADAQTLRGRVSDPQGGAVADADVRVTGTLLAAPRIGRSTTDGTFHVEPLAPGRY